MPSKIVISGFYGLGNTGDEAILEAMIDNLRSEWPDLDITVFSLSPEQTEKTHSVKSVYRGWRHNNKEKIRALREADLLISGGGGLLQDTYPTRFLFGPLPYYLLIVFLAKLCGTKVMFFSQGIGPVNTTWGKILMKVFANMADFITVRDEYSKQLLHQLGVTRPETVVTADIVFAFCHKQDDACMESLPLHGDEQLVAVSVRPWFHHRDYYRKIAKALDQLIELEDITPVFVPMEGEHDVYASEQVVKQMAHKRSCHILDPNFTPNQYLHFISQCRLTIGMRLHSLIFSALTGVPHIGLSYDKKVESLLKRSGMWDYSFRLENIDTAELVNNARYVLRHRESLSRVIQQNAEQMRRDALENIRLLKEKFFLQHEGRQ
ncbi:polysaccharide pyruvyl transferase CsaB [Geobacillus thermodenitrificans]|jgi:polysaccharide pyruvyl transferase CsaB|uniref:Polysaccharide pyruvyl transferase CsaB n=1 Tax=Geobacillus thermodenitrificans TaxID=33940 RepID=A0ABY9QAQ2_GEOTD|nr:polysaccharide pyruvyl transferase CsaB [Geobacillus thermodenitrificans]ARP44163.1 colanic acid biosynthesis pyruvyl transferase WcaK [Geobacillus thermodenitrificans]MED3716476.1 polysaccharide pyruvyl transferase CsaB [Geobacillus thermodenitrificans]MED4917457.1 polysaccharide pyruvyl transferase CsaB [Geobacillus thermodenitrificans]PTR46717.1 polysaccharide pyruvyl transferase CsaB [Geobacillus thermodenitrificans]WMV75984.1 polysaccharide pyruvyl transferase CsaB [Geobacillus thermod